MSKKHLQTLAALLLMLLSTQLSVEATRSVGSGNSMSMSSSMSSSRTKSIWHDLQRVLQSGVVMRNPETKGLEFTTEPKHGGFAIIAEGSYSGPLEHSSNFGQLRISTRSGFPDKLQMEASGFLEGWLTAAQIHEFWSNYLGWFQARGNGTEKVVEWVKRQDEWVSSQLHQLSNLKGSSSLALANRRLSSGKQSMHAASASAVEAGTQGVEAGGGAVEAGTQEVEGDGEGVEADHTFWSGVELIMAQLDGLIGGYGAAVVAEQAAGGSKLQSIPRWAFLLMNAYGDLNDLIPMLMPGSNMDDLFNLNKLDPREALTRLATTGHCSSLIRVTGDLQDIVMGHNTWSTYYSMVRIFKHYTLSLEGAGIKNLGTSMSGYPGTLSSIDDFFILANHLVVMETTNDVLDRAAFDDVVNEAALSWQRVLVANMMSENGAEWAEWVKSYNSGTYNNQFMVLDLNRFEPGQSLKPGLLTVTELAPGFSVVEDVTQALIWGHWPSYNVPYFKEIYERLGYKSMKDKVAARGPAYKEVLTGLDYQTAARAKIFRRDAGAVQDVGGMANILRQATWGGPNDTYSGGSPLGTLCARVDLLNEGPHAYGCIDAKVTSYQHALKRAAFVVGGPSHQGGLTPFSWSKSKGFPVGPHEGMLDVYETNFELQAP